LWDLHATTSLSIKASFNYLDIAHTRMPSKKVMNYLTEIFDFITKNFDVPVHPEQPWTSQFQYRAGEIVWICTETMDPDTGFEGTWKRGRALTDGELRETQFFETEEIARSVNAPFKSIDLYHDCQWNAGSGDTIVASKCATAELLRDLPFSRLLLLMNYVLDDDDRKLVASELSAMSKDDIINQSALQPRMRR